MDDRHSPESGPHRVVSLDEDETAREIVFEERLMEAMGVLKHDNTAALAWVRQYAEAFRAIMDADAEVRGLIVTDPARALTVVRTRLESHRASESSVA